MEDNLEEIRIDFASVNDIKEILSIQEENLFLLIDRNKEELKEKGFLFHEITENELYNLILKKEKTLVLVARKNNKIVGYALAFDFKLLQETNPYYLEKVKILKKFKKIEDSLVKEKILYFRHIARRIGQKGVGKELIKFLIDKAKERNYFAIIAEIMEKPIRNEISFGFFQKFGFEKIGEVKEGENLIWSLFYKKIN